MSTSIFKPVRKLLEQTFKDGWNNRTPVRYENVAFTQPANGEWVALFVRFGVSDQVSLGPDQFRMERHAGALIVQIFTPKNAGQDVIGGHADFAAGMLRMKTLKDAAAGVEVILRTPQMDDQAPDREFLQKNVSVAFQADSLF